MKNYLAKIKALLQQHYSVSVQDEDLRKIDRLVIEGNQSSLFHIEMGLCESQKKNCVEQLHYALEQYHYEGMETEEIKQIVSNVLLHRAPTPEITDTVSLLLIDE